MESFDIKSEIRPCPHMRNWVSALADGTLRGFARWFTRLHVKGCPQCREAFQGFQKLRQRLAALTGKTAERMPDERWESISDAWKESEGESA